MNIIQKILIGFDVFVITIAAVCVAYFVYDVITSIRAQMKRRELIKGKEEPHNGISESGR